MSFTTVLGAVCGVIAVAMSYFIIPFLKSKTTEQQRKEMMSFLNTAVHAAQQIKTLVTGDDRKEYVLNLLKDKKLKISDEEINAMLEAAVYTMNSLSDGLSQASE
jgi:inorganic pyrophosphatase/exopolyphosphatase